MRNQIWSIGDTVIAADMRAEGYSARLIARSVGRNRLSVIGKLFRLGWCRPAGLQVPPQIHLKFGPKPGPRPYRMKVPPIVDSEIPPEQLKTFEELETPHCRWPVDLDKRFFCGGERAEGCGMYCLPHYQVAYQQTRRTEQQKEFLAGRLSLIQQHAQRGAA